MKATPLTSESSEVNKNNFIAKINLALLYFILLILILSLIYFYSVYSNDYLSVVVPFTKVWPIAMILVGISIFRVTNFSSFAVGFLMVSSLVAITVASIFVQTAWIKDFYYTQSVPALDVGQVDAKINLILTNARLTASNTNFFKGDSLSNYNNLEISNYEDDSGVEKITLNHNGLPNGFGSYNKNTDIVFPNLIPASFDIKSRLSKLDSNFKTLKISSGDFDFIATNAEIVVSEVDKSAVLNIKSLLSQVDLIIDDNINVTFSSSSSFTKQELIGLSPSIVNRSIYKSNNTETLDPNQKADRPELVITLNSTLSKIKIIQKDI